MKRGSKQNNPCTAYLVKNYSYKIIKWKEHMEQVIKGKVKKKKKAIVAKFASFKDQQKILSETRKLKGTNININEDYSKDTLEIRAEK